MLPEVKISALSWKQITAELDRVAPREGIAVPLVALDLCDPEFNPCRTIALADIATVTIASVVLVPSHKQKNQIARVSVLEETDELVGEKVESLVSRYPRLRACAYLHSHPFAWGSTRPSRGATCDYEGHMLPLLESNRAAGLATSFSFIACRGLNGSRWRLQCFALDNHGDIVDLGFARVIGDDTPELAAFYLPGLSRRPMVRTLLRRWRRDLGRRGYRVRCGELFDGWTRIVVDLGARALVTLVPIDFPARPPQHHVVDKANGHSRPVTVDNGLLVSPRLMSRAVQQVEESHEQA